MNVFVNFKLGICSILFKIGQYDPRPLIIPPTSAERKIIKPGGGSLHFSIFTLACNKMNF
jgi:hypothetical protein